MRAGLDPPLVMPNDRALRPRLVRLLEIDAGAEVLPLRGQRHHPNALPLRDVVECVEKPRDDPGSHRVAGFGPVQCEPEHRAIPFNRQAGWRVCLRHRDPPGWMLAGLTARSYT